MGLKSPHTLPHGLVPTNNSHMGRLGASRQFYSPLTLVVQVVPRDLGHLLSLEGLPDPIENGARDIEVGWEASFSSSWWLGTTKEGPVSSSPSGTKFRGCVVAKSPMLSLALLPALQQALAGLSLLEVLSDQETQQHQEHREHQGGPSLPETD